MKSLKITALFLACLITVFALVSCGQASDSNSALLLEIEQLKAQISSQAALISSLLADKENDVINNGTQEKDESDGENETDNPVNTLEFEYVKENGGVTITGYTGSQTSLRVPESIEGLPVLKIGKNAFADSKLKSVTLPSCCRTLDWFAFYGCYALSSVYVSASLSDIGYGAFDGCSKNLTIYCPSGSYAQKYAKSFGISYSSLN